MCKLGKRDARRQHTPPVPEIKVCAPDTNAGEQPRLVKGSCIQFIDGYYGDPPLAVEIDGSGCSRLLTVKMDPDIDDFFPD